MRKKWKIVLMIFLISIVASFFLIFKAFWVKGDIMVEENYKDYIIYSKSIKCSRLITFDPSPSKEFTIGCFFLMFRWDYNDMINEMRNDIVLELETVVKSYDNVDGYEIDSETMTVDLYCHDVFLDDWWYEDENELSWYSELKEIVYKRIDYKCYEYYKMVKHVEPEYDIHIDLDDLRKEVHTEGCVRIWNNKEYILYQNGTEIKSPPIPAEEEVEVEKKKAKEEGTSKESEDKCNQEEIELLKKLLKQSQHELPSKWGEWDKVKWEWETEDQRRHVIQLDLLDYSDITGELDLTGFNYLQYVSLKNMNVNKVILPEALIYIDEESFRNCRELEEITIPKSVEKILNPVFSGCKKLKKITFAGNAPDVTYFEEDVFGEGVEDIKIYYDESAKGWMEMCWDKYEKIPIG